MDEQQRMDQEEIIRVMLDVTQTTYSILEEIKEFHRYNKDRNRTEESRNDSFKAEIKLIFKEAQESALKSASLVQEQKTMMEKSYRPHWKYVLIGALLGITLPLGPLYLLRNSFEQEYQSKLETEVLKINDASKWGTTPEGKAAKELYLLVNKTFNIDYATATSKIKGNVIKWIEYSREVLEKAAKDK